MYRWLHQSRLSRRRLRGSWLHSRFGDALLDKSVWRPTSASISRAWLIGWTITLIPFLPGQSLFACAIGLLFRANLILCFVLQFVSTPATAAIHLPAAYFVGKLVLGESPTAVLAELRGKSAIEQLKQTENWFALGLGGLVLGFVIGLLGFILIRVLAKRIDRYYETHPHRRRFLPSRSTEPKPPTT